MSELPMNDQKNKQIVTKGDFEWETHLNKDQLADFLISLGEQLKKGNEIKVSTKEWEIPFKFREPIELEIEFEGHGEKELEIEIEFKGRRGDDSLTVL
jgi:amphi-Trp domain-containing protein